MKVKVLLALMSISLIFSAAFAQEQAMDRESRVSPMEESWIDRVGDDPAMDDFTELYQLNQERSEDLSGGGDRRMITRGGRRPTHFFYTWMTGREEVPPHWSPSRGVFLARVEDDYSALNFSMYLWRIRNLVAAHIHLGERGENGPPVATLYGPRDPGGGFDRFFYKHGEITEDDLMGPLAGKPLADLVKAMAEGKAYVNVHTDDGKDGDDTVPGDYVSGEIRGQIRLFGRLPEPPEPEIARLQVIHNAADPAAGMVDIYVNGDLLLDDFGFREATPYIDVPANVELAIGVAPGTSTGPGDIIATFPVTLMADETYVAVANGVLDPAGFAANPDGRDIGFTLFTRAGAREAAMDMGEVDFFALHGSTDAPTVDVIARDVATLVDDAAYGDITDYLSVPPSSYVLDVTPGGDNSTIVASFEADLSGLAGGAAVVFASGFLNPAANQDGAAFGLFAALSNGTVVEFPALTEARLQVIHNAADPAAEMVDIYVNGDLLLDDFGFREATPYIDVPANVELAIGVAPGTSTGPGDIIATFPVTLMADETYVAVANGVLDPAGFAANPDGRDIGFTLLVKESAREEGEDPEKVDFFSLHGVTDAPMVDVYVFFGKLVVDDARYGDMTGYESLKARKQRALILGNYSGWGDWHFDYLGLYDVDLSGLGGGAAVVFASGFLNPAANQDGAAFGLFAALPNGMVVEFPRVGCTRKEAMAKMAESMDNPREDMGMPEPETFGLEQNYPNPFNPVTSIAFSLTTRQYVSLKVYDASGRLVTTLVDGMRSAGSHRVEFQAANVASGTYFYKLKAGDFVSTRKMILLR